MTSVKLRIGELRKRKGISQQDLAEVLGVSFQSVSKWETGATMPDIALLPDIAEYFCISVDELLGLKPLPQETYIPRDTDSRDSWNEKSDYLHRVRKYFWNDDYLEFLIDKVWNIKSPVDMIDFRCGDGFLGLKFLRLLPEGSTYTGVDNEYFIEKAKQNLVEAGFNASFIVSDIYSFKSDRTYDLAIHHAGLRHMNRPMDALKKITSVVTKDGLAVFVEVNREFENVGLYIDDISYDYLCTAFDYHKLWRKELESEGTDYAIGMRLPFYLSQLGLRDIDVRMNDKVMYVDSDMPEYREILEDFLKINGWDKPASMPDQEKLIERFMSRGLDRIEAEAYTKRQSRLVEFFRDTEDRKSFLKVQGLLVTSGRV